MKRTAKSLKHWIRRSLSDGNKPSMARQILIPLTAALIFCVVKEKPVPDAFTEIYIANVLWAGGGTAVLRWVRKPTAPKE